MANALTLGLDAAAGGIFGIVGTALGRVAGYFERKQQNTQERARWGHEYKLHELNMAARHQETELELALTAQQGSWAGLEASIEAEAALGKASQWVVNILRLVRPLITLSLWCITVIIFLKTEDDAIIEAAVFAATAATLWWFGDRAPKTSSRFS